MESDWHEFNRRDLAIITITAQRIDGLSGARKFLNEHPYRFPILFDETRGTTKAYGVFHRLGIDAFRIARPAAFILDGNAVVRWVGVSPNQTQWPTTEEILKAMESTLLQPER